MGEELPFMLPRLEHVDANCRHPSSSARSATICGRTCTIPSRVLISQRRSSTCCSKPVSMHHVLDRLPHGSIADARYFCRAFPSASPIARASLTGMRRVCRLAIARAIGACAWHCPLALGGDALGQKAHSGIPNDAVQFVNGLRVTSYSYTGCDSRH